MYRSDTTEEAQRIYDEKIRHMTEEERFLRGLSLTRFCRRIALESLKEKNTSLSPQALKILFFDAVYGPLFSEEEKRAICEGLSEAA